MVRRLFLSTVGGCFALTLALWLYPTISGADPAFREEFVAKYVKADSDAPKDKAFAEAVDKVGCKVCHAGTSKKNRNAYGRALAELLSRKTDTENKPKIRAALDKVALKHIDPKDAKSPTFGDLIKAGKLPGGEPKSKAESKAEDAKAK